MVLGYYLFIKTNLFVPKQEEIVNTKALLTAVFSEIVKYDKETDMKESDTIFFAINDYGDCGNINYGETAYENRIAQIKYTIKNPYYINLENVLDASFTINNKLIIVGNTQSSQYFRSKNIERTKLPPYLYRLQYTVINKNKVEARVTVNGDIVMRLILTPNIDKWTAKTIKI